MVSEYEALLARRLDAQRRADDGEITREELSAYLRSGAEKMRLLERRKLELAERLAQRQAEEAQVASVEVICQQLRELLEQAEDDSELRHKLARSLVKEVILKTAVDGRTVVHVEYLIAGPNGDGPDEGGEKEGGEAIESLGESAGQVTQSNLLALRSGTPVDSVSGWNRATGPGRSISRRCRSYCLPTPPCHH